MRQTRDIRTPADPQDFETLYDRAAAPPRDFKVTKDAGATLCIFEFKDFTGVVERNPTVEYRAYFIPDTITRAEMNDLRKRLAALRLGRLAASVSATGRGEWIRLSSPDFATTAYKGWFIAVGVNRRGVESDPTLAWPSPYN